MLPARPFEGLPNETDWVALHSFVPAATASLTLAGEHADRSVQVATVLPMALPVQVAPDGTVWIASQVQDPGCGDPSRDMAAALQAGLAATVSAPNDTEDAEDAEVTEPVPKPATLDGPRLQDLLDPSAELRVTVREGFEFWGGIVSGSEDPDELPRDLAASIERVNQAAEPTARLASVDAAYWISHAGRRYLRWVRADDEDRLLDALARLHARGASSLDEGSRVLGSFRADGLTIAVWELPTDAEPEDLEEPAKAFAARLDEALAVTEPLTIDERGARAGLVSRQFTLR